MTELETSHPLLVDHFEILRLLGSGAMGMVYLARDVRIGRLVALKRLHHRQLPDDSEAAKLQLRRFRREAELCGSLIHPNIVALHEVGYESRRFTYLAMEYIDGESVQSIVRRLGSLPPDATMRIAEDVLQALEFAHGRGIVHRDIKPANILMSLAGQAKLTDFGVASVGSESDLTARGQILGTPHYMAPEQIIGKPVDGRSDLFSLGVVLFELVTGAKPFDGIGLTDVLYNVVNRPSPDVRTLAEAVPPWFASFIATLLEKAPELRYPSATAALSELRLLRGDTQPATVAATELPVIMPATRELTADDTPTTPIFRPPPHLVQQVRSWFNRDISQALSFATIGILVAILSIAVIGITREIELAPSGEHDSSGMTALQQRRILMREADALYNAGSYRQSYAVYNRYLELYPDSPAAVDGRERSLAAQQLLEELTRSVRVTEASPSRGRSTRKAAAAPRSSGETGAGMAVGEIERDDLYVASSASAPSSAGESSPRSKESFWSRVRRAVTRH